jgi:hypothetical protein
MPIVHEASLEFNVPKGVPRTSSRQIVFNAWTGEDVEDAPKRGKSSASQRANALAIRHRRHAFGKCRKERVRSVFGNCTVPSVATRDG